MYVMTGGEAKLWRQWKTRGDRGAFQRLLEAQAPFVHDFARRICGHDADAEDLAQEAFLELAAAPLERPLRVGLRAFLGRRVVLAARTLRRAALARKSREARAPRPSPPAPIEARPEAEEALALLKEDDRRAVVLRFLHGLSYEEVATVLGTSEGAARVRVHRALQKLRARLGPDTEAALAALPLFLPAAGFPGAAAHAAALECGVLLMTTSAKRLVLVALLILVIGGGLIALRVFSGEAAPSRVPAREPVAAVGHAANEPATAEEKPVAGPGAEGKAVLGAAATAEEPRSESTPASTNTGEGRIRFTDGTPLSDTLVGPGVLGEEGVRTDAEGRFRLAHPISRGPDFCILGPHGYMLTIGRLPSTRGKAIEIKIERGTTLQGVVQMEATRDPVVGAILQLRRPGATASDSQQAKWGRVQSAEGGRFRFDHLLPAAYEITVTAAGIEPKRVEVDLRHESPLLQILVRRARDLVVRLVDLPEELRGTDVSVGVIGMDERPLKLTYRDLRIDARGQITVEAPPPGRYRISVRPASASRIRMPYRQSEFESVAGESVLVELGMETVARVEGTIMLPDDRPAARHTVRLERSELRTSTDGRGRFRFDSVPAGQDRIVLHEGRTELYFEIFDVPATGVVRRDIRLTGTGVIAGRLEYAEDAQNAYALLRRESDRQPVARVLFSGSQRDFHVPYLDAGEYVLAVGVPRAGWARRWVNVTDGEVDVGKVVVERTPVTPVVVTAPADVKLAGEFRLRSRNQAGEACGGWLALDADGHGRLLGLRPGRYSATIEVPGCAPLDVEIEVNDAPGDPLSLTLLPE